MSTLPLLYSYTTRNYKKNDYKNKYKDILSNNKSSKNLNSSKLKINVKNSVILNNKYIQLPKVVNETKKNIKIHSKSFEIKKPDLISKMERKKLNKLYGIDNNFNKNYIKIKKFKP